MRVLRVITRLDVHGGAELSTLVELEELAARGHDVTVVTVVEATTPAAVERLERGGIAHRHLDGSTLRQAIELRRLATSWRPDVVHAVIFRAELVTALACLGTGLATVVSLVNMQYDPVAVAQAPSPRRLDLVRRFESFFLRHGIDRFHCLTEAGARHSITQLGIDPATITVIPRGRRAASLEADEAEVRRRRDELVEPGAVMLLNVGRHELQKGQDMLLDVAASWRSASLDVTLVVAGREGNRTAELTEQVRRLGLGDRVRLLGARHDVPALLAAADVVCVTSRWEGLGGSIIEALGAGAPIVAFGVEAVREVVGDAGVIVEPFDLDAFATATATLLAQDDRRAALGRRARERFDDEFEIGSVVDRIEELYRSTRSAR